MDDNLWRSRKKGQRTRNGFPYSPTDLLDSGLSNDDESGRKRFEDIKNSSPSSSTGASSDDSSSSYEYRWEEAKPAKPPFQPFVTSVNVGKIELPAVKREFYAVIPLKAVLVILFPNNTPEDLELGIKKLELHSLTTFEAELLTNYVRGLRESDIPTFTVGDEIYVAEFCRGEIGCSYESLKAKFAAIMNSLLNEVPDLEQDRPVFTDIIGVDKLHIDQSIRTEMVTYPPPAVCSLPKVDQSTRTGTVTYPPPAVCSQPKVLDGPGAKKLKEGLGKGTNAVNNDYSEAMQTGDSNTPCDSLVQLHSCFSKKCVIAHVGEKIPEEQTCKKRKHGRRTSSETSLVNCPKDAKKETLPCSKSGSKSKVAVVLKHLFPENEEDEESSTDSEDDIRKDKESGSSSASTSEESTVSEGFPGQETRKTSVAVGGGVLKRQESEIDSMVCNNKISTSLVDVVKGSLKTSGTASENIGIADQLDDTWESMLSAEISSATGQLALRESESCVDVDHISSGRRDGIGGDNVDGESTRDCGDRKYPCSLTSSSKGLPCENSKATVNPTEIQHSGSQADLIEEKSRDLRILVNDLRDKSRTTTPEVRLLRSVQPEVAEFCKCPSSKFRNPTETPGDNDHDASELIDEVSFSNLSRTITFERRPFANDVNLPTNESAKHLATPDLASIDNGLGSPNPEWTVTDSYICGSPEAIDEKMEVMSPVRSRNAANSKRSRDQVDARRDEEVSSKGRSTSPLRRRDKNLGRSNKKARSPKRDSGCKTDSRTQLRRDDRSRSTSSTDSRRRAQRTPTKSDNVSRRKWRPEEMYGGSGQRIISFGDRNRIVQRTTRFVPDYSRLRFHYRPELYSPVSSSETDYGDIDDDDCICTRKPKQKVLHRKSSRDDARVRSERLSRETSATRSEASSGKASVRNGTEQSMSKQWGGRGGAFPKFPVRREPSVESEDFKSKVNPEEVNSIVPGLSNEIESLIVGIRRKCERESPTQNFRRISESPRRARSRRRSHSPSCVRSFSPAPRRIGLGLRSRRRSLTPTSNATKRDGYVGYRHFSRDRTKTPRFVTKSAFSSAKSIYASTNEHEINRHRDGNTFKKGGGVLAVNGEGNTSSSSHSSEIHYSSARCCHNTKLRDDSHTTNAGVCGSDELTHYCYCSPFRPFVQSYRSVKSSSAQLSMHEPTRGYVKAQGSRITGAADSAICCYNILLPQRPLSDDEQVIILKDPQELDSSVEDLWPFLSVGSDHESSMDDSCDGEVEGLMLNKLTRLRKGSHYALDTVESPDSNFVSAESTTNVVQCDLGLPTQDVASTRKSDRYIGLNQNTRDERHNDTAITRSIDVSTGTGVGENVESSTCGVGNACKLDPSHDISVPITVELKSKRKELHGDGLLECDTAVDSPCAYEEVVMQDHDINLYSANTAMLQEGSMGDASEIPDVSEPFTKTVTEEIPTASSPQESGTKDNFPISACDIGQNDETEALDDAALGQDVMCVGATITIEGERQIVEELKKNRESASASSSSKSWKKLLLLKAQSDPSSNNAVDDKVAEKGTEVVEQVAMCTTSTIARNKEHVVGTYGKDRVASETAVLAELDSNEGRGEEERSASIIDENVKFDYGEKKLCDPPQGSAPSSKKGLELSEVRDDEEIAALTEAAQNEDHFLVNDGKGKFADLSESSTPSLKKEFSKGKINQKKAESKSMHSDKEDLVVVGGNGKSDDLTESAAAGTKESESSGMRRTFENRTEQNTDVEMREDTVQELGQSVALPTANANENDASSREGEEVEPARNSAVEITKNSPESSNTVTIEKGDVGMQKVLSPVNRCTNQQYMTSEVHIDTGKRTQPLVTSTPCQSTVTDEIPSSQPNTERFASLRDSSLLANDPCAVSNPKQDLPPSTSKFSDLRSVAKTVAVAVVSSSASIPPIVQSALKVMSRDKPTVLATVPPLKFTVPTIPTTVNTTRVTAVPTSSDTLSAFPKLKITVRATSQSVTKSIATSESVADFKQKGRLVLATPAKAVELPATSPEQPLMEVAITRRSETHSSHILGRKLGGPHSLIFSTVVRNAAVRDLPPESNATLASRKTFRGPQVKHKSVLQTTAVISSDARPRSSSLPDQPSLISKRPEFMSSQVPTPFDISSTSHFASSPQVSDTRAPSPSVLSSSANEYSSVAGNVGVLTDSTPHLNHGRLEDDRIQQSNMNTKETASTMAQNSTSSVLPEKPLKSILRKPTVSFDASVGVTPSDNDIPMKTFDECLQDGEDVIQSLLPLIKKRKYTPRKKRGSSLKSQTVRHPVVSKSSRGRAVKRTALRGKGRPKRRKRLPSISSDEDIIEELSAGTSQSLPKAAKAPPPESEVSDSEQEDGDEDLFRFMGVVSERTTTEATEITDEAGVAAGNEALNDEGSSIDDNNLLYAESDSEEDMRPLSELAKCNTNRRHSKLQDNKTITANEGSARPNSSNELNTSNSNRIDAHENIFTKMAVEIQARDNENEVSPTNLDSFDSAFANENFERSLVEMENKGVRERGIASESPASHVNECTPEMQDSISSLTSNTPQNFSNAEKAIKQSCGQDEHHRVSEETVGIPLVASNPFCEMGNDDVQPLLPTPPTSPKSDETRPTAELSAASVENVIIPSSSTSVGSPIQDKQSVSKPTPDKILQDSDSIPVAASPRWLEPIEKLPKGQAFCPEPAADPPLLDSDKSVVSLPNEREASRNQKQVAAVQPVSGDDLKQICSPEPQETRNNQEIPAVEPVVSCSSNPILAQQNADARREMPESREEVFHAPVSSRGPDLSLSTEYSQEIAGNRKASDGISNLIAAAAELAGLTDSGYNGRSVTAPFTGASAVNHELKTVERQVQEVNNSRRLVDTPIGQPRKRKDWTPFVNYNMPEAESCHGFLEVCMSAPPQRTYALRRIPYVKTTTTHNAKAPSTSVGLKSSQDYSAILPTSSACATYLRLRDVICLIKVHPEALFSLVTRCEAALYSPNEYTRRLFAVVYDPVCVADENMSKMWMRHFRCVRLQAFLDYMIILDKFLHSLLPRFYFEALGVQSVDVPKFVNVKIFKPIPDINDEVVQIFRQPYEYNSILRNKDDKIKCNTMQRKNFSLSSSNARKRSHSSDSSGSAKVAPTEPQPQQAVPAPLSTVPPKTLYDDRRFFPLEQHPRGFYLSSEAPRFACLPRNVGMHQRDLSTPPPRYEKQVVLARPTNATGMNGAICFRRPNLYVVSQSQRSATASSQHLAYRGDSSRPYVTAMSGTNVIRYTGGQDHPYVLQNTRPMHNPQPYIHVVRPQHPLQLSYVRNDIGAAQSSPTSRQNPSLHHVVDDTEATLSSRSDVEESVSITSDQQEKCVKKNAAPIKEVVCSHLKNVASSNMLTTKEVLKDLPHILRQKSKEGEAAAKVYAMSEDDEDINLKKDIEWAQASAKHSGTDSAHLSGVASKPLEVHNVKAKRRRKDSGSKKTKASKPKEPRRELIWKPLLDSN